MVQLEHNFAHFFINLIEDNKWCDCVGDAYQRTNVPFEDLRFEF